jgi:hypothetical protein
MYGIYANIGDILMVNVTIYTIHGSYGIYIIIINMSYRGSSSGHDLGEIRQRPFLALPGGQKKKL